MSSGEGTGRGYSSFDARMKLSPEMEPISGTPPRTRRGVDYSTFKKENDDAEKRYQGNQVALPCSP